MIPDLFLFRRVLLAILPILLVQSATVFALQPDEIALIVNSNEPAGRDLAQFYAQARHIPDNRILELSLPTAEEMSFEDYEKIVVPQVREFLKSGALTQQVKCFVTFYGIPLRIAPRQPNPDESREQAQLRQELLKGVPHVLGPVQELEKLATQLNPSFSAQTGGDFETLGVRAQIAAKQIIDQIGTVPDVRRKTELLGQLYTAMEPLVGETAELNRVAIEQALKATANSTTQPATPGPEDIRAVQAIKSDYQEALRKAADLEQLRYDPKARGDLRTVVFKHFGGFGYAHLLQDQVAYLETKDTGAAFDSELALVQWMAYPRSRWRDNPLYFAGKSPRGSLTYMVMRLDAPRPEKVKDIINASIQVENTGLKGKVVIDSRGIDPTHEKDTERGYADYDQSLRDLGDLISSHTKLQLLADDKPETLPPSSADDVALYCGWYSVRNYVHQCKFNPGAVGYHIASYEMISLHTPGETGWVAGLLNDGVAATLGPVAEPYIQAFPKPAEFFPLLMTGKLSLAEVYWKTTRMSSWMIGMVGDPLYTPYKTNPAIAVEDLPLPLQKIFKPLPAQQ